MDTLELVDDAAVTLSEERFPAMLVIDLALIGQRLVTQNPKPLFLIDMAGQREAALSLRRRATQEF